MRGGREEVVIGQILAGHRIVLAADLEKRPCVRLARVVGVAVEHHVFEEMGHAPFGGGFVAKAGTNEHVEMDDGVLAHLLKEDGQAGREGYDTSAGNRVGDR